MEQIDKRVADVIHRLLAIAEDLLACAISGEDDLSGFVRDYACTDQAGSFLRIPAWELADALARPDDSPKHPLPVTPKEAAELLLRLSQDCRGSGPSNLPIAPNPEFMEEVEMLLSRLPADLLGAESG